MKQIDAQLSDLKSKHKNNIEDIVGFMANVLSNLPDINNDEIADLISSSPASSLLTEQSKRFDDVKLSLGSKDSVETIMKAKKAVDQKCANLK